MSAPVVLFDLDGTLIDSVELIRSSYCHMFETHFGRPPGADDWLAGLGRPLLHQLEALTSDAAQVEAMRRTYRAYSDRHHHELLRPYPGMLEAVRALAAAGARLGVVTSKLRAGALRGLADCGFEDGLFEVLIGADDVTRHKPLPDPVLAALERLGAAVADAVFVGDSPHDIAAGRAAGTATAAVLWGPFPRAWLAAAEPDRWLATPAELSGLLAAVSPRP